MALKYTIIPEDHLEHFVCSQCCNYRSYRKSKIGSTGIICGRCYQSETYGPIFDKNTEQYLFPCINRFDNCKMLLHHWEVEDHERECAQFKGNRCTECRFQGNGCQLYHHYIKHHPDNVLKCSSFTVPLRQTKSWNYLHRKDNNLSIVTYHFDHAESLLKLTVRNAGNTDNNSQFQFAITSCMDDSQLLTSECKQVTRENESFEVDTLKLKLRPSESAVRCHLNVKVIGELFFLNSSCNHEKASAVQKTEINRLKEKENQLDHVMNALHNNLFPKLSCSNCGCFVVPPIYRCPAGHVRCEDCNSSFCSGCDDVMNWSRASDLESFSDIIPLPCRWDCDALLLSSELREHERTCSRRRYRCVERWCLWSGNLDNLIQHWHSPAPVYTESHQVYGFREELLEFYSIFNDELFYWRMGPLRTDGREVHVRKVSSVSRTSQLYSATIFLTHKCDGLQKDKQISAKLKGVTLVDRSYFDFFGPCKNYKIIFVLSLVS